MNVQIVRQGEIWQYNPLTEGYTNDDVFHAITGTPAVSSNKLRLNADEVISYDKRFKNGSMEFLITIPTAPASGDVRQIGLKNNDNKGAMLFDITDTAFTAKVYDASGTIIATKTINWSSGWTAAEARYRISWGERDVYFAINDTIVARFEAGVDKDITEDKIIGKNPIAIYLKNSNSDNMDVSLINFS